MTIKFLITYKPMQIRGDGHGTAAEVPSAEADVQGDRAGQGEGEGVGGGQGGRGGRDGDGGGGGQECAAR